MKKIVTLTLIVGMLACMTTVALAASDTDTDNFRLDVDEIAVIDHNGTFSVYRLQAPATGGDPPVWNPVSWNGTCVQYTSIVEAGKTRTIDANLNQAVPAGLMLDITAATPVGTGTCGTGHLRHYAPTDGTSAKILVSAIGSCYTGSGAGPTKGARLTFQWSVTNIALVTASAPEVQFIITYTLTEDS